MKKQLWIRLRRYRFENLVPPTLVDRIKSVFGDNDAFTRAFATKIAQKHNWSSEFAFLAIREYKKFVYLGTISHYDVTPSRVIDVVWHEHQLFTRGYREFCQTVLGKHFDHDPELIPFSEQAEQFSAQYLKTLAFYQHEFGTTPPAEIWGRPKFNQASIKGTVEKPEKKRVDSSQSSSDGDTPLFTMFTSGPDVNYAPIPVTFTSGQGGDFGGGGGGGTWSETTTAPTPGASTQVATDAVVSNSSTASESASASSCSTASSCGGGGGGCSSS